MVDVASHLTDCEQKHPLIDEVIGTVFDRGDQIIPCSLTRRVLVERILGFLESQGLHDDPPKFLRADKHLFCVDTLFPYRGVPSLMPNSDQGCWETISTLRLALEKMLTIVRARLRESKNTDANV
jgi:hypothetical protein